MTRSAAVGVLACATVVVGAGFLWVAAGRDGATGPSEGPAAPATPAAPTPAGTLPTDPAAAWADATARSVLLYERVARWMTSRDLPASAALVRRRELRYRPDDPDLRAAVGDRRAADGSWVRDDERRAAAPPDRADPRALRADERLARADSRVAGVWRRLARHARAAAEADPDRAAVWDDTGRRAWEALLRATPGDDAAHRALGHPKLGWRYVRPEAVPFLRARSDRDEAAWQGLRDVVPTAPEPPAGSLPAAGIACGAVRSARFSVVSADGAEHAADVAASAERTLAVLAEVVGLPLAAAERPAWSRISCISSRAHRDRVLGARSNAADVQQTVVDGELVVFCARRMLTGEAVAYSVAREAVGRYGAAADADGAGSGSADWLLAGLAFDVARRVGWYSPPELDALVRRIDFSEGPWDWWIALARCLAESNDDPTLAALAQRRVRDRPFAAEERVKAYAVVRFLFESDAAKAREFVRRALVRGTPEAAAAVYGASVDELDRRYREWLRITE